MKEHKIEYLSNLNDHNEDLMINSINIGKKYKFLTEADPPLYPQSSHQGQPIPETQTLNQDEKGEIDIPIAKVASNVTHTTL